MRDARDAGTPNESAERLLTLVAALSEHDKLTRGHSERVRAYAVMIGEEMRLDPEELDLLNWAALLHDIGKLDVSGEILRKPGRPTEAEWEQLKRHPLLGERLVGPMGAWLGGWSNAVGYHHERWDGEGYPRGVAGDEIPLAGRIVAIADVFDVITSARSYKAAGAATAGREEIARCAGTQFDPRVVRAFLNVSLGRMRLVMGPLSWLAHTPVLGRLPLASTAGSIWSAVAVVAVATGLVGSGSTEPEAVPKAAVANARTPATRLDHTPAPARARMVRRDRDPRASGTPPAAEDTPSAGQTPADAAPAPPRRGGDPVTGPPVPPVETMTVNDPPAFTGGPDQVVREDAGARTAAGWATGISPGPASESGQSIAFHVANDAPGLFGAQPQVRPDGTLTFTPAANASGVATVTVRAVDNGGTENGGSDTSPPQTFTIAVTPANDPPGFAAGPDEHVLEDAGAQTVAGWATGVTARARRRGRAVRLVRGDERQPGPVQRPAPQSQPDGTLTYAAAADASGTATVTVRAVDSGGTRRRRRRHQRAPDASRSPSSTSTTCRASPRERISPCSRTPARRRWRAGPTGISPGPLQRGRPGASRSAPTTTTRGCSARSRRCSRTATLTYTPAAGASGLATVTVQAVDDGGTAFGGGRHQPRPDVHDHRHRGQRRAELHGGAGPVRARGRRGAAPSRAGRPPSRPGPGEGGQAVTFSASNDNPGLFSAQPQVQPNGTLTYTPAANASGIATVTVRALDDGGTALRRQRHQRARRPSRSRSPPSTTCPPSRAGADQLVLIDSGPHVVGGWATGISAGPGEGGQSVSFSVSNDNAALFSAPPQVQPNGTLTYTPARGRQRARHGHGARGRRRRNVRRRQRHERPADVHDRGDRGERRAELHGRPGPVRGRGFGRSDGGRLGHGDLARTGRARAARPSRSASRTATRRCSARSRRSSRTAPSATPRRRTRAERPP